jgi:hypothetical protein
MTAECIPTGASTSVWTAEASSERDEFDFMRFGSVCSKLKKGVQQDKISTCLAAQENAHGQTYATAALLATIR